MASQTENLLLVNTLAVDTKGSLVQEMFVEIDGDYWPPDLLRPHEAETLKKQYYIMILENSVQ